MSIIFEIMRVNWVQTENVSSTVQSFWQDPNPLYPIVCLLLENASPVCLSMELGKCRRQFAFLQ
jgi:hypothetical protein